MRPPPHRALVLSCEHGGRRLPAGFGLDATVDAAVDAARGATLEANLDAALRAALDTHRGWDPGALALARQMAALLGAPLRYSTISRLVVEPNRSESSPELFSPWSRHLPERGRQALVRRYHRRHRRRVRQAVEAAAGVPDAPGTGPEADPVSDPDSGAVPDSAPDPSRAPDLVVHVGVHSFTPVLEGQVRPLEVGILLDPARDREREVALAWAEALTAQAPELRIHFNEPYDGRSDGLVTTLRGEFAHGIRPGCAYAGLELEVNQGLLGPDGTFPRALAVSLAASLATALAPSPR